MFKLIVVVIIIIIIIIITIIIIIIIINIIIIIIIITIITLIIFELFELKKLNYFFLQAFECVLAKREQYSDRVRFEMRLKTRRSLVIGHSIKIRPTFIKDTTFIGHLGVH